jgi:hypothetical protein
MNRAFVALLCALVAQVAQAAPDLQVFPLGLNGSNNREWAVDIALDPIGGPTSVAVELAFAIDHTDLVGVAVNTAIWEAENPGNNPFTGTVTNGLWLDLIGDRTFGAFGSAIIATFDPTRLFTIETLGSGLTTVRYGVAASGSDLGSIIATVDVYSGYTGSVTVPEPASGLSAIAGCAVAGLCGSRRRRRS